MTFETLDVDVLLSILCLTDVYTVLSISRVSKYLHEISCSKAVWLSLARQLYKRHVLVLPINALETVSVDELKDAVKRVADGPKTWKVSSPTPPTVIRREVIPLPSAKGLRLIAACTLYTLVVIEPWNVTGGEDIRAVRFYEAETGRELWTWSISECLIFSAAYDFSSFSTPLVVLSLQDFDGSYISVLEGDLSPEKGLHTVFTLRIDISRGWMLHISGDFVGCDFIYEGNPQRQLLLINWRTEQYVIIKPSPLQFFYSFHFLPGHIVLFYSAGCCANVLSLLAFDGLWQSTNDFDITTSVSADDRRSSLDIHGGCLARIYENPFHADMYDLVADTDISVSSVPSLWERLVGFWSNSTRAVPNTTRQVEWQTRRTRYALTVSHSEAAPNLHLVTKPMVNLSRDQTYRSEYGLRQYRTPNNDVQTVVSRIGSDQSVSIDLPSGFVDLDRVAVMAFGPIMIRDQDKLVLYYYL